MAKYIGKTEDRIQQECIIVFRQTYPQLSNLLFSVPNGGTRNVIEAQKMKQTGLTPGVSDMLLMYDSQTYCIEMKTTVGRQSTVQLEWEQLVTAEGFPYVVLRDWQSFMAFVFSIMGDEPRTNFDMDKFLERESKMIERRKAKKR